MFFVSRNQKLMTAGWKSKEDVTTLTYLRWNRKAVETLLKTDADSGTVSISAMSPGGNDRLGELEADPNSQVFLDDSLYKDIESEVVDVVEGRKAKTGMLLYGQPGNGKTQFVK